MELTIKLEDNVDISFIKRLLLQLKGVKSVKISEEEKTYPWEEMENSEDFAKVIEQSRKQIRNGEFVEHSKGNPEKLKNLLK